MGWGSEEEEETHAASDWLGDQTLHAGPKAAQGWAGWSVGLGPSIHPGFCSPGDRVSGWVKLEDPGPESAVVPQLRPSRPLTATHLCRCWFGKEPGDLVDYVYQGPIILVLLVGGAAVGWAPGRQRGPTHRRFWGGTWPGEAPCAPSAHTPPASLLFPSRLSHAFPHLMPPLPGTMPRQPGEGAAGGKRRVCRLLFSPDLHRLPPPLPPS